MQVIVDPEQFLLPVLSTLLEILVAKESGIHDLMTHTEFSGRFLLSGCLSIIQIQEHGTPVSILLSTG